MSNTRKRKLNDGIETNASMPEYKVVSGQQYENEFTCCVCQLLVTNPVVHSCRKMFCRDCLDEWKKNCPSCRGSLYDEYCTNILCQFTTDAMNSIKLQCSECKTTNIPLSQWKKHYTNDCGSRCTNKPCNVKTSNQQIHNETCPYFTFKCRHKHCNWVGQRKDLTSHLNRCEYEKILDYECKASRALRDRDTRREILAMRHNGCATVGLFDTIPNNEVAGLRRVLVEDGTYNETSNEFKFMINSSTKTVEKGDHRLVHLVTGVDKARSWEELECKLFYIRNRRKPDPRELIDISATDIINMVDSSQESDGYLY